MMVLGTFHFAYPNFDVVKTNKKDQIDVSTKERQAEIQAIVDRLKKFKPTKVAIEVKTWEQSRIDNQYAAYLKDSFELSVDERHQIGFRLAKQLGHTKIYCIDAWGNIDYFFTTTNNSNFSMREEQKEQLARYDAIEDSLVKVGAFPSLKSQGIDASKTLPQILTRMNAPSWQKDGHSRYFGPRFQIEATEFDYTGTDWVTFTWYSRNLRIFRNIQRMTTSPNDRILAVYGAGHAYLLNQFLSESANHSVVSPLPYLK